MQSNSEKKRYPILIFYLSLFIVVLCFLSCGYDDTVSNNASSNMETGSFSCNLKWPESVSSVLNNSTNSRALDCEGAGIDPVVFTFYDSNDELLTGTFLENPISFDCVDHSGRVDGLPPGLHYDVTITAQNTSGRVQYSGEYDDFSIVAGSITRPPDGEIVMQRSAIDPDADYTNSYGMSFKRIDALQCMLFSIGSESDELGRDDDELRHWVAMGHPFYIQTTEVTQGQWEAVMGNNPSHFQSCGSDCPVENVYWNQVQNFIAALNDLGDGTYRLPTEAEWECVARAGSATAFANGEITETDCAHDPNLDAMGWSCYNADSKTHPVALKNPNDWGLYDMHGNVYEFCQDWFGDYESIAIFPTGPKSGDSRVRRGGGWDSEARYCRSANRGSMSPTNINNKTGFRLAYVDHACTDADTDSYYAEEGCGTNDDCDDTDENNNPEAAEVCDDNVDNDCDGYTDCDDSNCASDAACLTCTDTDTDTYYAESGCGTPVDCNDNDENIHPGATEICDDSQDNDCDGSPDCLDTDCVGNAACRFTNSQGMTFNLIPPGTFTMGSPSDELGRDVNETEHTVTLTQPFYMQTTEVTQAQWQALMGNNPACNASCGSDCPIECIGWNYIKGFLSALNSLDEGTYRLPTEAEWEYAARAGSTTAVANGDITVTDCTQDANLDAMGWYCFNAGTTPHPVAQKDANAWGLYDMHGNVWEWVRDYYQHDLGSEAVTNPTGPFFGTGWTARGGSYDFEAENCRAASRTEGPMEYSNFFLGFRLAYVDHACTDTDTDNFYTQNGCGTPIDCNDSNASVYPGLIENCSDGIDNNCDGITDCDGMVAFYSFEGNANDETGSGHDCTTYGTMLTSDRFGTVDSAYWFNGTAYIHCPSVPQIPNVTLVVWFLTDHDYTDNRGRIIESASASGIIIERAAEANRLDAFLETGYNDWNQSVTSETYNDDNWHMAAITYDGSQVNAYIDGILYNSTADTGDLDYDGNGLWIGRLWSGDLEYFYGSIDDIMIYNRALSANEIQALYNNP